LLAIQRIIIGNESIYMKFNFIILTVFLLLSSCKKEVDQQPSGSYAVSGQIINTIGIGIEGVQVFYSEMDFVLTKNDGTYTIDSISGTHSIAPIFSNYAFTPPSIVVNAFNDNAHFSAGILEGEIDLQIYHWLSEQQLPNGLVESVENGNIVSLYDNALASMAFMLKGDDTKAEKIFDFFNARIGSELNNGVGGFSQFRNNNGVPSNHRWMGDNAWMLIALNHYKKLTGNSTYDLLASEIANWLIGLQDSDGGLFAGYDSNNSRLNYKVTEGMIDAFNAIDGYSDFHSRLLQFLAVDRWDSTDKNLVAWPGNPNYLFALDLHPWSYSIFQDYPISALTSAQRFITTQTATNGALITGYCFDEDKDVVWPEGTGQMAVAFGLAGMHDEKAFYLSEMEKVLLQSSIHTNAAGFPYASNPGTTYASDVLWNGADTEIAVSGGVWYLFAKYGFNPFAAGREKYIPETDMFWLN